MCTLRTLFGDPSALAQLVEQLTVNQWVAGSSPAGGAKFLKAARCAAFFMAGLEYLTDRFAAA